MDKNKKYEIVTYKYDEIPEISCIESKYREIDQKLLEYLTKRVRSTFEYKAFIQGMKRMMKINKCTIYKEYSMDNGFIVEMHHAPIKLLDYVRTVCNKWYAINKEKHNDGYIEEAIIVEEVLKLHYQFFVGLIPLNPTAHELADADKLQLHIDWIEGDWQGFIRDYGVYVPEHVLDIVEKFKIYSKTHKPEYVPEILDYKPVYIDNVNYISIDKCNVRELIFKKHKEAMQLTMKEK